MNIKFIKIGALTLISTLALATPFIAYASQQKIWVEVINNTNEDSTAIINDHTCSTTLGIKGITKAHSINFVDIITGVFACSETPDSPCKADVYMTNDCSGDKIATLFYERNVGIVSVQPHGSYKVAGSGYVVTIDSPSKS